MSDTEIVESVLHGAGYTRTDDVDDANVILANTVRRLSRQRFTVHARNPRCVSAFVCACEPPHRMP